MRPIRRLGSVANEVAPLLHDALERIASDQVKTGKLDRLLAWHWAPMASPSSRRLHEAAQTRAYPLSLKVSRILS